MLDEYVGTPTAALEVLDKAAETLGGSPVLVRARAKVLYRGKDHEGALRLLASIAADTAFSPTDRAFMLREAGISAAELERWEEARKWFDSAAGAALLADGNVRLMAIGLKADGAVAALMARDVPGAFRAITEAMVSLSAIDPEASLRAAYLHRVIRHAVLWFYGQVTGEDVGVDGSPAVVPPGACSNPEPPETIRELPLANIDIGWYLLATAELATDTVSDGESTLRERLKGRVIAAMEVSLRTARLERALRRLDTDAFLGALEPWLDAYYYAQSPAALPIDLIRPVYEDIPSATTGCPPTPDLVSAAEWRFLEFGVLAALGSRPEVLARLHDQCSSADQSIPGAAIAGVMSGEGPATDRLEEHIATAVRDVSRRTALDPDTLFIAGLRPSRLLPARSPSAYSYRPSRAGCVPPGRAPYTNSAFCSGSLPSRQQQ
jgi:hypothetical protein